MTMSSGLSLLFFLLLFTTVAGKVSHVIHISIFRIPFLVLAHRLGVPEYVLHHVCYALVALYFAYRWDCRRRKEQRLGAPVCHQTTTPTPVQTYHFASLPWLGHALTFVCLRPLSPWNILMEWHRQRDWAPAIVIPLPWGRYLFSIASPSLLQAVLQQHSHKTKTSRRPLCSGRSGLDHGEQAQTTTTLHKGAKKILSHCIPEHTVKTVQRLCQDTLDHTTATPISLRHTLRQLTVQVMASVFVSLSDDEDAASKELLYLSIMNEQAQRQAYPLRAYCFFLPAFWQHAWNLYCFHAYIHQCIQQRVAASANDHNKAANMLDLLLKELPPSNKKSKSLRSCRHTLSTFLLQGHETNSAETMAWTLQELMAHPKLAAQVRQEADTVLGGTTDTTPETVSQLTLAEACVKESLRKYNVVPVTTRVITNDFHADGVWFPKGNTIALNMQSVHLNPQYWPEPMKYDPTRFLQKKQPQPFTFVPLSGKCAGQQWSMVSSKLIVALLMQRYEFSLVPGDDEDSMLLEESAMWTATQNLRQELMVQVKKR